MGVRIREVPLYAMALKHKGKDRHAQSHVIKIKVETACFMSPEVSINTTINEARHPYIESTLD